MEVTLPPELQNALDEITLHTGRPAPVVVAEAVERYLEREHRLAMLRAEIQVGIDELDRGEGREITPDTMRELADEICREGREEVARRKRPA
jgi:predicted transcriptional regulator